jgi:CheY-specific phosphatase CheX
MSFLSKNKKAAMLRAKTKVVAYRVDQCPDDTFEGRLASASISLMKVMATRLDIVNRETRRLEPYQNFYSAIKGLCDKNKELKKLLKVVENEVEIKEQSEKDNLLSRYLTSPWIWSHLENAIFDIMRHYLEEDLRVDSVEAWREEELLGVASGIPFEGDRNGKLIIDLSPELAKELQCSMGIMEGDYGQEMAEEMNNLILGQLKRLVKERSILLKTPKAISNLNDLKNILGGEPALEIDVHCPKGHMRLIYQLDIE